MCKLVDFIRIILQKLGLHIKSHNEGRILPWAQCFLEEIDGRFLFEVQAFADTVARVNQHADAQGQVGFPAEEPDVLRVVILEDVEVVLRKVKNHTILFVGHREQNVHQVNANSERLLSADGLLTARACVGGGWILRRNRSCKKPS